MNDHVPRGFCELPLSRRQLLQSSLAGGLALGMGAPWLAGESAWAQEKGDRPPQGAGAKVLNPLGRVPVSFIIDDSTCLVNLAHFCIPQFAEVFPDRYLQDWKKLPREIPDSFVREFGEWCHERGIKGKYSQIPHPACVGWLDRDMPGWSRRELEQSIKLVRDLMMPDWDIHPEMVTHTWVIDTKTGRPYGERNDKFLENWGWSVGRSADEIGHYMSYALKILKNVGLTCEGITTPGGFGNRSLPALSQGTLEACRDVFGAEIPHYFRHLYDSGDQSVAPRVEYASGLATTDPKCVVSIIGCTGDWFGGWDGLTPGTVDQFITQGQRGGRLPQVIDRGEPAVLVCHWPGIYYNGEKIGFNIFKEVVGRLHERYDHLIWMKLSEIARYWAAKELTAIGVQERRVLLQAPFATPRFTLEIKTTTPQPVKVLTRDDKGNSTTQLLVEVDQRLKLASGNWCKCDGGVIACFELSKGETVVEV